MINVERISSVVIEETEGSSRGQGDKIQDHKEIKEEDKDQDRREISKGIGHKVQDLKEISREIGLKVQDHKGIKEEDKDQDRREIKVVNSSLSRMLN